MIRKLKLGSTLISSFKAVNVFIIGLLSIKRNNRRLETPSAIICRSILDGLAISISFKYITYAPFSYIRFYDNKMFQSADIGRFFQAPV